MKIVVFFNFYNFFSIVSVYNNNAMLLDCVLDCSALCPSVKAPFCECSK